MKFDVSGCYVDFDLCSLYLACPYLMFVNWCGCCELWFECESMFEIVSVEFENH